MISPTVWPAKATHGWMVKSRSDVLRSWSPTHNMRPQARLVTNPLCQGLDTITDVKHPTMVEHMQIKGHHGYINNSTRKHARQEYRCRHQLGPAHLQIGWAVAGMRRKCTPSSDEPLEQVRCWSAVFLADEGTDLKGVGPTFISFDRLFVHPW